MLGFKANRGLSLAAVSWLMSFLFLVAFVREHASASPAGLPDYEVYGQTMLTRYKPHLLAAALEFDPIKCTLVSSGSFVIYTQPKYGTLTLGTTPITLRGLYCSGMTFTAASIVYTWTEHDNKADTDYGFSQWVTGDYAENFTLRPNVPIVRPTGETTMFTGWESTRGLWVQHLTPPSDDPGFDFTGETVREFSNGDNDLCFDGKFPLGQASLTPHDWVVHDKVVWGPDGVGWGANSGLAGQCAIEYYRCVMRTPCGAGLRQQMTISSPADNGKFVQYGPVNALSFFVDGGIGLNKLGYGSITSKRADGPRQSQFWPSGPASCPSSVHLPC